MGAGRPSIYTQSLVDTICNRLSTGESLRSICRDPEMPDLSTVIAWRNSKPGFSAQYDKARLDQADTLADEILAIADETPELDPIYDKEGNLIEIKLHPAYVTWQKNRVDARKWVASKLKPKYYGDSTTLKGDAESPVKVDVDSSIFATVLDTMLKKRQVELTDE